VLTAFGAAAVTFMVAMYALESRHPRFILAFACGCVFSSVYGFLAGTWPFGAVEAIWAVVASRRYRASTSRR
jgi:predicted membrane-bound mannosyltransferase